MLVNLKDIDKKTLSSRDIKIYEYIEAIEGELLELE